MIILAFLFPPLYLLLKKKYIRAAFTGFLFLISMMLCVMVFPPLILWAFSVWLAVGAYRSDKRRAEQKELAQDVATKTREAFADVLPQAARPASAPASGAPPAASASVPTAPRTPPQAPVARQSRWAQLTSNVRDDASPAIAGAAGNRPSYP